MDATEFPQIAVQFRPLDREGVPVAGLAIDGFSLTENSVEMTIESLSELPDANGMRVHFVIDAGASLNRTRWPNARQVILSFVESDAWMNVALDEVAVTAFEANSGRRPIIDYSNDPDAIRRAMNEYSPPGGTAFTAPLPTVNEILEELALKTDNKPQFIVFITAAIENQQGNDALLERGIELDIPIHTVFIGSNSPSYLSELSNQTGGMYVNYQNANSMNNVYNDMILARRLYELSYRSTISTSGTRQITIASGPTTGNGSYDIEVNQPRILITTPNSGDVITRQSPPSTVVEDLGSLTPTTQAVVATVVFPDEHLRRLRRVTLLVDGQEKDEVLNPNPNQNIELTWNLRDIQSPGINAFTLQVEVEDELGLVSTSPDVSFSVNVVVPPSVQATLEILSTKVAETPVFPTATPYKCIGPDATCTGEQIIVENIPSVISITIAIFALAFAIIVYVNRDKAPVQAVRNTVINVVTRLTKRYKQAEPRAYLVVLEGDTNVGKTLEIFGNTTVGRSRQDAELLFQQADDNSPISRRHCSILDEEDHFMIRDEDSANGTYLNGTRLRALDPTELHDGDEIELARVERGGVRLLFQVARGEDGDGDRTEIGRITRQTRGTASQDGAKEAQSAPRF
jgi:pSer/pThr/pTyr-binding forkhead associated (FHA) protein/Mg-chelatase subunit ChlD